MANHRTVSLHLPLLILLIAIVGILLSTSLSQAQPGETSSDTWLFQGRVFQGYPFDQSHPLSGVRDTSLSTPRPWLVRKGPIHRPSNPVAGANKRLSRSIRVQLWQQKGEKPCGFVTVY